MKSKFKGYYKPQPENLKKIWDECIFIFDTNVLFDFYRYSDETVEVLFTIFENLKDKIWIPHWVGLEYHRGLEDRIKEQVDKYTSTIKDLTNFSDKIKSKREHPFLNLKLQEEIKEFHEKFNKELYSQKNNLKNLITDNPIKEKVADLIGENIGDENTQDEIDEIIKIGDDRMSKRIPPGYMDYKEKEKRPGLDKYGDYIIWKQILKQAGEVKKPVIFVTFDTKEDWYKLVKFNNSKILVGPRPELIEEFHQSTECSIWLYPTTDFIDYAVNHFNIDIEQERLNKAKAETTKPISLEPEYDVDSDDDTNNDDNESLEAFDSENFSIEQTSSDEDFESDSIDESESNDESVSNDESK